MASVLITRLSSAFFLLFGLLTIVFLIAHLAPGDPMTIMSSPTIPSAVTEELRHQFGLDRPLVVQYGQWLKNACTGNFGVSFSHHRQVFEVIGDVFPNTAMLALAAICLEVALGILLAFVAVRYQYSIIDSVISYGGLTLYTLPTFWVGIVLLAVFSYGLGLFPSSNLHSVNVDHFSSTEKFVDLLQHLALPVLTIAIPGAAGIARYFRPKLVRVQQEEYVTFARSLGISKLRVFFSYELLNAIGPVITIVGLEIGTLLAGALVTETIFAWPGMGRLAVQAIFSRDYPLIMGCTLISGVVVILGNLIADLFYTVVDPRVRIRS